MFLWLILKFTQEILGEEHKKVHRFLFFILGCTHFDKIGNHFFKNHTYTLLKILFGLKNTDSTISAYVKKLYFKRKITELNSTDYLKTIY